METIQNTQTVISQQELLNHWQGHRNLTRRVIEAFPETDFFEFNIAGMRTAAQLTAELLSIGAPAMTAIVNRQVTPYSEPEGIARSKAAYLAQWDADTNTINEQWAKLSPEDFSETFNLFGQYEFPVIQNVLYFVDNEIHHRGQMYVYLRGLGIEPPFFWER